MDANHIKFLGTSDEVTTCDCCGKKDLKATVALSIGDADPVYFGVVCAARALKMPAKDVRARGRYEITTPQGSVSTGNQAVAVTLHSALQQVGARPRLRDRGAPDPRDGIDRIEGARVFVEVDGCQVPMSASDAGRV